MFRRVRKIEIVFGLVPFCCNWQLALTDRKMCFSFRRTVKNIPKYAPAQFYIDNVLPRIKEKKIMALKPFVDRLG